MPEPKRKKGICVITHRGLDAERQQYFPESSPEAFTDQLRRGYGLEFDVQFTEDSKRVICHDSLNIEQRLKDGKIMTLRQISELISQLQDEKAISALHLKGEWQERRYIDFILEDIASLPRSKFIIFDVKPEAADYLKSKDASLVLAPSVAHEYDIERYNKAANHTLMSVDEALSNKRVFDWVWLDEWDLSDKSRPSKRLYSRETFDSFHDAGFMIALVMPELHATSPGLLGGEAHQDAKTQASLFQRHKEIIELGPDAVCTDYPDSVRSLAAAR